MLLDQQRAEREREACRVALAPYCGEDRLRQLIEKRRAELAELERLAGPWMVLAASHADAHVHHANRRNQRLFCEWPMPQLHRCVEVIHG